MKTSILSLLLIITIIFFLIIVRYDKVHSPTEKLSYNQIRNVLQRCVDKGNTIDQKCVYAHFLKIIDVKNVASSIDALTKIYSEKNTHMEFNLTTCHIPAHIIGQVAYKKGMVFSDIVNACSNKCGFGCVHGAFQSSDFVSYLSKYCTEGAFESQYEKDKCLHAIGHGVAEYYGNDIKSAGKACMTLPDENGQWQCLSGLEMEKVTPSLGDQSYVTFTYSGYTSFCRLFPPFYQNDCYSGVGNSVLKAVKDDGLAVELCKEINSGENARKCAAGVGAIYTFTNDHPASSIFELCNKFKNDNLINECVIGAIGILQTDNNNESTEEALKLCKLVKPYFSNTCIRYFEGKIKLPWRY